MRAYMYERTSIQRIVEVLYDTLIGLIKKLDVVKLLLTRRCLRSRTSSCSNIGNRRNCSTDSIRQTPHRFPHTRATLQVVRFSR